MRATFMTRLGIATLFLPLLAPGQLLSAASEPVFLSDHSELILNASQDWGVPGFNTAAHAPDKEGQPLRIGDRSFQKGLGHHANGTIFCLLDGQFGSFEAEVGLQSCDGGSVVFRVFVDGQARFDSGVMRSGDAPKSVRVSVAGAQELRLEAGDAGDGISCDMANWGDARLTLATNPRLVAPAQTAVDIARFARVVTWDPSRMDGARASRIEEFRAEEVYLETDLAPERDGAYRAPVSANGLACLGLQWLNRRALRELSLSFADAASVPPTNGVRVEGWFGESAWQGGWKPLSGSLRVEGERLVFGFDIKAGVVQTQKIRWVLPASGRSLRVKRLSAFSRSRWETASVLVQVEKAARGAQGEVGICNGEFVASTAAATRDSSVRWRLSEPLPLTLRFSRPSTLKSDPTVLLFRLPGGAFGVAVDDLLSNKCVYVSDHGLFVSLSAKPLESLPQLYKQKIAGQKTILQQVRELPDQTLAQAMAKTHHDAQREGPVMLSLACENTKFVVERDGTVRFQSGAYNDSDWFATAGEVRPAFGNGRLDKLERHLDGGWLPIPVISVEQGGVVYQQRTFVAPSDQAGTDPARLNRASGCVIEFSVTNTFAAQEEASIALGFLTDSRRQIPASLTACAGGYMVLANTSVVARVLMDDAALLQAVTKAGRFTLSGPLPAGGTARFTVLMAGEDPRFPFVTNRTPQRAATEAYWDAVLAPAMQVTTPEPLLNDIIRSSQVRCLIAARNEADGARVAPWIAAMSYGPLESEAHSVIRGMDFLGHADFAQRGLDFFIHRYNTNGFLTTGYTTFGTAWHLWTLAEHWQLTRDTNWLRHAAPELARVGRWIVAQTEKTKQRAGAPESGLMPPGVLADWNSFACHFAMNAYYVAALQGLGEALGDLGHRDAALFKKQAAELRSNTLRAYAWTQAQAPVLPLGNGTWIPHYPSQVHSPGKLGDFFPGQDAGRSWCYDVEIGAHQLVPTGVLDPRSREVERMLDHMEDVQFLADGWFDYPAAANHADWFSLGGFSKVQPYYTRNCEVYALRDDVKPFVRSYFNTLAAMLNPEVLTFWEHFRHSGAWDKTHETGYFLHQTRTMLVQERGDELWLAPMITDNCLRDGLALSVSNAPTRFGKVSYRLTSHLAQGCIEAAIEPPARQAPKAIVLRLRHPEGKAIRSVEVNGRSLKSFDRAMGTIRLPPDKGPLRVKARFD